MRRAGRRAPRMRHLAVGRSSPIQPFNRPNPLTKYASTTYALGLQALRLQCRIVLVLPEAISEQDRGRRHRAGSSRSVSIQTVPRPPGESGTTTKRLREGRGAGPTPQRVGGRREGREHDGRDGGHDPPSARRAGVSRGHSHALRLPAPASAHFPAFIDDSRTIARSRSAPTDDGVTLSRRTGKGSVQLACREDTVAVDQSDGGRSGSQVSGPRN